MEKGDYILAILRSKKTVFSFKDIVLLWGDSGNAARVRVNYYVKNDDICRIRQGLYAKENYSIATPGRAFLDVLYLNKDYYFDNLSPLDRDKVFEILPVYGNQRMTKKVKEIFKSNPK